MACRAVKHSGVEAAVLGSAELFDAVAALAACMREICDMEALFGDRRFSFEDFMSDKYHLAQESVERILSLLSAWPDGTAVFTGLGDAVMAYAKRLVPDCAA